MSSGPLLLRVLAGYLLMWSAVGEAIAPGKNASGSDGNGISFAQEQLKSNGPYAIVEWNAGDLLFKRARILGEYIAVDGLAFGVASEFQRVSRLNWQQTTTVLGVTASQYFQSLSLRGVFARSEAALFQSVFSSGHMLSDGRYVLMNGEVYGLMLGLNAGYRYPLSRFITSSLGAGVRRTVPDFFQNSDTPNGQEYAAHEGNWQFRIDLGFGIGF